MRRLLLVLMILPLILLAEGCATQPTWSRYELCFGRSADAGKTKITDQQWRQFRDEEITSRFPDGFTVYHADGYWRDGTQAYAEPSEILMLVAPDTRGTEQKLKAIAQAYARRFRQEAVLQVKSPAEVDFHTADEPAAGGR